MWWPFARQSMRRRVRRHRPLGVRWRQVPHGSIARRPRVLLQHSARAEKEGGEREQNWKWRIGQRRCRLLWRGRQMLWRRRGAAAQAGEFYHNALRPVRSTSPSSHRIRSQSQSRWEQAGQLQRVQRPRTRRARLLRGGLPPLYRVSALFCALFSSLCWEFASVLQDASSVRC